MDLTDTNLNTHPDYTHTMNMIANASDLIALVNAGAVVELSSQQRVGIRFYHAVEHDGESYLVESTHVRNARRTIVSGRTILVAPKNETPRWVLVKNGHALARDEITARYVNRPTVIVVAPNFQEDTSHG